MIKWAVVGVSLHKLDKLLHESTPTMNIDWKQANDMIEYVTTLVVVPKYLNQHT